MKNFWTLFFPELFRRVWHFMWYIFWETVCKLAKSPSWHLIIGSAEALPILCVRYFRWEREREIQRERERERRKWRHHCRVKIGPLRIDVTVTAKWPLWVLRNVTPFTPSHFRQSSEQIFLVLVFVFLKTVFLEFVSNALWTTYLKS